MDPYSGQPYMNKKKANCPTCASEATEMVATVTQTDCIESWTQTTVTLPKSFSYLDIVNYSKKSGKKTTYVEKPIDRGYAFYMMAMFLTKQFRKLAS